MMSGGDFAQGQMSKAQQVSGRRRKLSRAAFLSERIFRSVKRMIDCGICGCSFDPETISLADPAVEVGLILAREKYGDAGTLCTPCLANRGRLAMMYDPDLQY
jgi:hypothetical protein